MTTLTIQDIFAGETPCCHAFDYWMEELGIPLTWHDYRTSPLKREKYNAHEVSLEKVIATLPLDVPTIQTYIREDGIIYRPFKYLGSAITFIYTIEFREFAKHLGAKIKNEDSLEDILRCTVDTGDSICLESTRFAVIGILFTRWYREVYTCISI
jgi:hypothetical protein